MPLEEFCNIFHLLYSTLNKYYSSENKENENFNEPHMNFQSKVSLVSYEKYLCNFNHTIYDLSVKSKNEDYKFVQVGISIFFPTVKYMNYESSLPEE
jgi:hypothetical protein